MTKIQLEIETWKSQGFSYLKYNGVTYVLMEDFQRVLDSTIEKLEKIKDEK